MSAPEAPRTQGEAIAVLGVQMVEVIKDVTELRLELKDHRRDHEQEERQRVTSRRWLIVTFIAAVAAIDGPLVALLLALLARR